MQVKEVIKKSANILELSDVVDYLNSVKESLEDTKELDDLIVATNMAINNISANYISVCERKKISSNDGIVYFSDLTYKPVIQVKKVLKDGKPIRFRVHNDCIELGEGQYEIVYSYFPDIVTMSDDIDYFPQLSELIFSYSVVAEYLFLKGQIDDAYMWDKRFKSCLLSIKRPCRNIMLPKRRWW
ncbi:MAG: hypothetical protein E7354_00910 [Clostridiales bacterium]|nr:hypothetical protein [Clostridiales bacterium]